jgi:hypothetical protein
MTASNASEKQLRIAVNPDEPNPIVSTDREHAQGWKRAGVAAP